MCCRFLFWRVKFVLDTENKNFYSFYTLLTKTCQTPPPLHASQVQGGSNSGLWRFWGLRHVNWTLHEIMSPYLHFDMFHLSNQTLFSHLIQHVWVLNTRTFWTPAPAFGSCEDSSSNCFCSEMINYMFPSVCSWCHRSIIIDKGDVVMWSILLKTDQQWLSLTLCIFLTICSLQAKFLFFRFNSWWVQTRLTLYLTGPYITRSFTENFQELFWNSL